MDRETLKQKIADAIFDVDCRDGDAEGPRIFCDDPRLSDPDENCVCKRSADAVLSAISEAGCVIVADEPTRPMLEAARDWSTEVYGKPVGNGAASGILKAMLSASPFSDTDPSTRTEE